MFKSKKGDRPITRVQAYRIISRACEKAGITTKIGTHTLRKTFGYHIWHNANDKEKAIVMLMVIFNHTSVSTTKKYIGIMGEEVEDVFNGLNLGMDFI